MKKFLLLCASILVFGSAQSANAIPINFDVDASQSSVEITNVSTWPNGWTSISAILDTGLDSEIFSLNDGESYTFDFFQITVDGLGTGTADIEATLAFEQPSGSEITGNGSGWWGTIYGVISAGYLGWVDMPQAITLANGDYFDVDFEDVAVVGFGNSTTVSATVTAHAAPVPEPTTILLSGIGLLGMGFYLRKRKLRSQKVD